ncbi:unnamed protein product [Cyprideis torosa]|uniref:Uncharacterized protein n=1 Tax=Cyprideis torosa TaxID=163714 RepID=A0A7R8WXG0_9CRUS|nr:unnamed protein product [Cyprideis torosa]CAG0909162.1 unnamed protein product [Cyprideis torosa]
MDGGRIVQYGTPESIVLNPGNDYVAEFVAHMNPVNVLKAVSLMQAVTALQQDADMTGEQHQKIKVMAAVKGITIKDYVLSRLFNDEPEEEQAWQQLMNLLETRISNAREYGVSDKTNDIGDIAAYTLERWGYKQARIYVEKIETGIAKLASKELPYKQLSQFTPPVLIKHCEHHYIFAQKEEDYLLVIAILHERMDFISKIADRLN